MARSTCKCSNGSDWNMGDLRSEAGLKTRGYMQEEKGPRWLAIGALILVAGAGFVPDLKCIPILISRWLYVGARQGAKDMQRVGVAV